MTYQIKFDEEALDDFKKALSHYNLISISLSDQFHKEFWNNIDYLKLSPLHFQLKYKEVRISHLKKFPYAIHYIMDANVLFVFRILHHKQFYK